jgi:hypothetical protein
MTKCNHLPPRPNGVCPNCQTLVCRIGLEFGCYCSIGWPYEKQCIECRDKKNRIDSGYCACVPVKYPNREHDITWI